MIGTMDDDLVTWLRAQLDDDERIALAATPGPWRVDDPSYAETIYAADDTAVVAGGRWGDEASVFDQTEDAIHIARHHPARVLAEVDAKRRILDLHGRGGPDQVDPGTPPNWAYCATCGSGEPYEYPAAWPCETIKLLALPYADQPGYRDEWCP